MMTETKHSLGKKKNNYKLRDSSGENRSQK